MEIEKNVPMVLRRGVLTETMRLMEVGDSFAGEAGKRQIYFNVSRVIGIKITQRIQSDGALRVWRVK